MKMDYTLIDDCALPKSSFMHLYGKLQNTDEYTEFVINVDKINYIKRLPDNKTLVNLANTSIVIDFEFSELMEGFLNQVNLLSYLHKGIEL